MGAVICIIRVIDTETYIPARKVVVFLINPLLFQAQKLRSRYIVQNIFLFYEDMPESWQSMQKVTKSVLSVMASKTITSKRLLLRNFNSFMELPPLEA